MAAPEEHLVPVQLGRVIVLSRMRCGGRLLALTLVLAARAAVGSPLEPIPLSCVATPGSADHLTLEWPILYQIEDEALRVFDVSNPATPVDLGVQIRGGLHGRPIADSGFLFVSSYTGNGNVLLSIDATNPLALSVADSLPGPAYSSFDRIRTVSGSVAYLSSPDSIYLVDISDPFDLRRLPGLPIPSSSNLIEVVAGKLVVPGNVYSYGSADTLLVFDLSNPTNPQLMGGVSLFLEPYEYLNDSAARGTNLLLLTTRRLLIFDTAAFPPTLRSSLELADYASRMSLDGDYLLLSGSDGMTAVEVVTPSSPTVVARYRPGPELDDAAIHGSYAFLSVDDPGPPLRNSEVGLLVLTLWSAPTPARPMVTSVEAISSPSTWERIRFARSGFDSECAYDSGVIGYHVLRRIEALAKERNPAAVFAWPGRIGDVVQAAEAAFEGDPLPPGDWEVAGSAPALQQDSYAVLLNLPSTPNTYIVVAHTAVPGRYFVSTPFPEPTSDAAVVPAPTARLYPNLPNPFNPTTTIRYFVPGNGAQTRLQVFDVAGRLVATLADGFVEGGEHRLVWSSEGSDGRPLASGVYLCRLQSGGFSTTRRMALLR